MDLDRSRKHLATHYSHDTSTRSVQLLQSGAIANQAKTVALWAEAQKERHKITLLVSRLLASMRRPYLTRKVFSAAATFHLLRNRVSRTQRAFSLATRKKVLHTTLARQERSQQLIGAIQLRSQHQMLSATRLLAPFDSYSHRLRLQMEILLNPYSDS